MPFYTIQITKNLKKDETITKKEVQLNLNDIQITPTNSNQGTKSAGTRNNVYQFTSDNYSFRWEQTNKGGAVEIYQLNKKVKEIDY